MAPRVGLCPCEVSSFFKARAKTLLFVLILRRSSLSGKARSNTGISGREPGSTSGSRHGVGDLFTALRRQGLIADELVLQLATFLRSLDLFLELTVRTVPRTLTTGHRWSRAFAHSFGNAHSPSYARWRARFIWHHRATLEFGA